MSCVWMELPTDTWLCILSHLSFQDILRFSQVSTGCYAIAMDEILWRRKFREHWQINNSLQNLNKFNWLKEFKRLYYQTPVEVADTAYHENEVLHVSFSNNGQYLVSSSKDKTIKVFSVVDCGLKLLKKVYFGGEWLYVQFTEFTSDDKYLLVSGVTENPSFLFKGEVHVLSVEKLVSQQIGKGGCEIIFTVACEPYDAFGCWSNNKTIATAFYQIIESRVGNIQAAVSDIWLFDIKHSTQRKILRVLNQEHGTVKLIHVVKPKGTKSPYNLKTDAFPMYKNDSTASGALMSQETLCSVCREHTNVTQCSCCLSTPPCPNVGQEIPDNDVVNSESILLFVHGTTTFVPHVLVFVRDIHLLGESDSATLTINTHDGQLPDNITIIDTRSYIIGMAVDPEHQYLYVNCRKWKHDNIEEFGQTIPGIDDQIELRKYDMNTLELVETLHGHRANVSQTACFFIYPDVASHLVASGAEDKYVHIWDRTHGCKVGTLLEHTDVVNAVAFNPQNQEMLASVSDDFSVKLWLSKRMANLK